jgi:hypothetical protein
VPDFIITETNTWNWNNFSEIEPVLNDDKYSLIKLSQKLPNEPLLLSHVESLSLSHISWVTFLAPDKCNAVLFTTTSFSRNKITNTSLTINNMSLAQNNTVSITDDNLIALPITLGKGYNFISIGENNSVEKNWVLTSLNLIAIRYQCGKDVFISTPSPLSYVDGSALVTILNPYGNEQGGYWLGKGGTQILVEAQESGSITFSADFLAGPSIPETPVRHFNVSSQFESFDLDFSNDWQPKTITFSVQVQAGINTIKLVPLDTPSVALLPNGDKRLLLIYLKNLKIHSFTKK